MADSDETPTLTAYVVLELLTDAGGFTGWAPILNATAEQGPDGEVRLFAARNDLQAIRLHTGDGADTIPGTWKAVPWRSWKGGETTTTKVVAERLPFDDGPFAGQGAA